MTWLWGRRAKIIIARQTTYVQKVPTPPIEIASPLRIEFKITKKSLKPPNLCEATIYNLSQHTRASLEQHGVYFELYAGYNAELSNLPLLFAGVARTIDHRRERSEWRTVIQSMDGDGAVRYCTINKSWGIGVTIDIILKDLALAIGDMGYNVQHFINQIPDMDLSKMQFVTGFACFGNAIDELERLIETDGWRLSFQNNVLQAVSMIRSTTQVIPIISPTSGMIGSPSFGAPDRAGRLSQLKVKSFLLPHLNPGDTFQVDATNLKGKFWAEDIEHVGDTHGGSWFTEIATRYPIE
jgi:hypothetical protein